MEKRVLEGFHEGLARRTYYFGVYSGKCALDCIIAKRPLTLVIQDQVDVARFTAENLATFDYKSLEEVFFVIRTLTMLLSVAGMQIVSRRDAGNSLDCLLTP